MKSLDFGRYALFSCVASAMLAGCGGSQPPVRAPVAVAQTEAIVTPAARGKSWMLPEAKSENLLYVSDAEANEVYILSYPSGAVVGTLTGFKSPTGECVDRAGNVWITNVSPPSLIEYAHGGTAPIANLSDPNGESTGCSVDPTTGDLAVGNGTAGLAIYRNAQGLPVTYTDPDLRFPTYCTYDDEGNLFFSASSIGAIGELPKGGSSLIKITLNQQVSAGSMQWDQGYLAIRDLVLGPRPYVVYHVQVSGSSGTVVGKTELYGRRGRGTQFNVQYWIQGSTLIGPGNKGRETNLLQFWNYPQGGKFKKLVSPPNARLLWGTVVSPA